LIAGNPFGSMAAQVGRTPRVAGEFRVPMTLPKVSYFRARPHGLAGILSQRKSHLKQKLTLGGA